MTELRALLAVGLFAAALASFTSSPGPAHAQNASCQQSCAAQRTQCRIATKGSASCEAAYHSCLQACVPRR